MVLPQKRLHWIAVTQHKRQYLWHFFECWLEAYSLMITLHNLSRSIPIKSGFKQKKQHHNRTIRSFKFITLLVLLRGLKITRDKIHRFYSIPTELGQAASSVKSIKSQHVHANKKIKLKKISRIVSADWLVKLKNFE